MIKILTAHTIGEFKTKLAYKRSSLLALISSVVQTILLYYFWDAVYKADSLIIQYVVYARIINFLIGENGIWDIAGEVKNGNLITKMIRPYGFIGNSFFKLFSSKLVTIIIFCLPMFVAASIFIYPKFMFINSVLFVLSLLCSVVVGFCVDYMFSMMCIFTNSVWGISALRDGLFQIFSGALIPVDLLPIQLQGVLRVIPFSYMVDIPIKILTQQCSASMIVVQILYSILLLFITYFIDIVCLKKLSVQGG